MRQDTRMETSLEHAKRLYQQSGNLDLTVSAALATMDAMVTYIIMLEKQVNKLQETVYEEQT